MLDVEGQDLRDLLTLPLFSSLGTEALASIYTGASFKHFGKDAVIFEQGSPPDFLYVLLDGSVQMIGVANDGRETLVEIVTPVDSFILAAALTGAPVLMKSKVLEPARILMLPADRLRRAILSNPELASTMLASLAGQYRRLVRQIKNLKLRTSVQRVACYLQQVANDSGQNAPVRLPFDKSLIASQLGMTRESFSRALAALREYGISTSGNSVYIDDATKLRAYCIPDSLIDGIESELRLPPDHAED